MIPLIRAATPQLLFWCWNLLFATAVLASAPGLVIDLVREAWRGFLPWDLALTSVAVLLAPLVAIGAWFPIRADGGKVGRLFFGIELPLCFVLLARLFLLREVTPAVAHLLLVVSLAGFVLTLDLFRRRARPLTLPELAGHAVLLVTALWPAAVVAIFVPPAAVGFVEVAADIVESVVTGGAFRHVTPGGAIAVLAWMGFSLVSMALFLVGPLAFLWVYLSTFARLARETAVRAGWPRTALATVAGLALTLAPAPLLSTQPQVAVLARLEAAPDSDAARAALVADADVVRAGLLNAWLAPHRYWTSTGTSNAVTHLYRDIGGGEAMQAAFDALASPFVYQGPSASSDKARAEALYRDFFDTPIQRGERDAILRALNATWDRSTAEAGLLDVGGEKVLLARQSVHVDVRGDLATVRIDEEYRNQTTEQQEVHYYFSLPTSAAVTGLWLSDDPADPERYPGVVAPRGAAQQVYVEERQRRSDPALLEQVGPRQYRLRAFPILPRTHAEGAPPLTVRFTYTTPVGAGGVPLPRLLERRNVFWDGRTTREGVADPDGDWLPAFVPGTGSATAHEAHLDGYVVRAEPGAPPASAAGGYAVVLDTSRSMAPHEAEVREALARLRGAELYVGAGWGGAPARRVDGPFDPAGAWFGALSQEGLLLQFATLSQGRRYDAVLVLTDAGAYDVTAPRATRSLLPPDLGGPVWMVHLGGALAPAYDDAVLDLIHRSGGGVAASVDEALARLAAGGGDVLDGYTWTVRPADPADGPEAADAFLPLAARQLVLARARGGNVAVEELDALHRVAKRAGVVTPYSSLIALVDEQQRRRLAELEKDEDRFDREAEIGAEAVTTPSDAFAVTAVPEPEEWALLAVGTAMLLVKRRRAARERAAADRAAAERAAGERAGERAAAERATGAVHPAPAG